MQVFLNRNCKKLRLKIIGFVVFGATSVQPR